MNLFAPSAAAAMVVATTMLGASAPPGQETIPRAASTPNTPKNWVAPAKKIHAQVLIDELMATHPELASATMHGRPPGAKGEIFTMFAGSFPDRIGNESSPGDLITIKKGVSQVESKWGTPDWQKKVSVVLPLKDSSGKYLSAAIVLAFKTSPDSGKVDTDYLQPGVVIRDALKSRIPSFESLFAPGPQS
jgi:hypothetical protein